MPDAATAAIEPWLLNFAVYMQTPRIKNKKKASYRSLRIVVLYFAAVVDEEFDSPRKVGGGVLKIGSPAMSLFEANPRQDQDDTIKNADRCRLQCRLITIIQVCIFFLPASQKQYLVQLRNDPASFLIKKTSISHGSHPHLREQGGGVAT